MYYKLEFEKTNKGISNLLHNLPLQLKPEYVFTYKAALVRCLLDFP